MTQMAGDKLFELFNIALDTTSSPRTVPSRGDLEKDDILNSPGYKNLLEKGLIPPPVKKADASLGALAGAAFGSPITASGGIKDLEVEAGEFGDAPQWVKDQMWKQDLRRRQELGLEPRF